MATGKISINSTNLLPIIKKWLYSDKDIFLRELVSNASDAINKLKFLQISDTFRIDIKIDKTNKTLSITDNGIGMSSSEVKKYICEVAFSGAEEFISKYKDAKDELIGHFGLGFFSAYMVAKNVTIDTKSYLDEPPVFWSSDGTSSYEIEEGTKTNRGTTITLFIDSENESFLLEDTIKDILLKYCPFLPFPIYLNDKHLNNKDPLWLKAPNECSEKDYEKFFQDLYPFEPSPIFYVHINIDYPFNLKGVLYFPKISSNLDLSKNSIKLFCNKVFVSDNCKEILPEYLTILKGAIDSPEIPLNVSRSYLQMDENVRKIGTHISKKICDRLSSLYTTQKEQFLQFWPDIETIIKLGILQDEIYDKAKSFLVFKTTKNEYLTLDEYLAQNPKKIFYTNEPSHFLSLYDEKKIPVLLTNKYIDIPLLSFLETKLSVKFQRIDGGIDDTILDKSKEKSLLDSSGKSVSSSIAQFVKEALEIEDLEIEAKSLSSSSLSGFILCKEEERRIRDYLVLTKQDMDIPSKKTFVVNTNSPLINKAYELRIKDLSLAKDLILQIYNLALLSQKELSASQVSDFIAHSNKVLEKLSGVI